MIVFKYELPNTLAPIEQFTLDLPRRAKFLKAGVQHGNPVAWFQCEENDEIEKRHFVEIGTGVDYVVGEDYDAKYLDTITMASGALIWHIYEIASK